MKKVGVVTLFWCLVLVFTAVLGGTHSAFADFHLTNPEFIGAKVKGATLTLTYDEDLDEDSVPAPSAFTVKVDEREVRLITPLPREPRPVAISGAVVTLTLASAVTPAVR